MVVDLEPVAEKVQSVKNGISKVAVNGVFSGLEAVRVVDGFGNLVNGKIPELINVQWVTSFAQEKFIELTQAGCRPLGFGPHFVWYDAVLASEACYTLSSLAQRHGLGDNLSGFALTLAKSVKEGQQSRFMKAIYSKMEEFANARNVDFIPITRKKDEKYGLHQGVNLDDLRPLILRFRQKGIGGMIFPGGSVEPGRHPKDGSADDINGLLEITDSDLWSVFKIMDGIGQRHTGQKPYFLPMGINKGYRLQSPDSKLPTPEGLISLSGSLSDFLSRSVGFNRVSVNINIGTPITLEEIIDTLGSDWDGRIRDKSNEEEWEKANLALNGYLMRQAALLIEDEQSRGFYK